MTMIPKVSVILTSYNHDKFLTESIDSVLCQTFSDLELIIWDDASIDSSWQIINRYTDPRIKVFQNKIRKMGKWGIKEAIRNVARGEYIAIHHSDDVWEPQKLEKQVTFLDNNHEIGAVFTNAHIIDECSKPFEDRSHFYYSIFDQPNRNRYEWLNYFFYNGNALCHPSVLIRKKCYDDCGVYRNGFAQLSDFDMWVRICRKYEIYVLPEKLTYYRILPDELKASGNRPEVRIRGRIENFQILQNYKSLSTFDELEKVFPEAKKYNTPKGGDVGFALGMIALEAKRFEFYDLFGLMQLFEAINEPAKAARISELYHFTEIDFIALTARHDVFASEFKTEMTAKIAQLAQKEHALQILANEVQSLTAQIAEREQKINVLSLQVEEIKGSRIWKLALFLQRIRVALIPPNGRIDRMLHSALKIVFPRMGK